MKATYKAYERKDFTKVRDFLSDSFRNYELPRNWFIDRWNFVSEVGREFGCLSKEDWEKSIGLWTDEDGRIVALANEEEGKGDVFFQFLRPEIETRSLLEEMFAFAEKACRRPRSGGEGFALRVPGDDALLSGLAQERGYRRLDWSEPMSVRPIAQDPVPALPPGYRIVSGPGLRAADKALAHARAFGYTDNPLYMEAARRAFPRVPALPDYIPDLDLAVYGPENDDVSFCTLWLDADNSLCVLEPVGTAPEHRGKGLAAAAIAEGCARAFGRGARRCFVGSDQAFYLAIGFRVIIREYLWEKLF